MLTFIYSSQNVSSIEITDEVVVHLIYAAERYDIQPLKRACVRYLKTIRPKSAACVLLQALRYNDMRIAELCCESACSDTTAFLSSPGFLKCDVQTVEMIIERDNFIPKSEVFLLEQLLKWASMKCQEKGMEQTMEAKRKVLGKALYLVRFPLMKLEELQQVALLDILTETELGQLFYGIHRPSAVRNNFISQKRMPKPLLATGFFSDARYSVLRRFSVFEETTYTGHPTFFAFSVNRRIKVAGVGITGFCDGTIISDTSRYEVRGGNDKDAHYRSGVPEISLQSVEKKGEVVRLLSDQFPDTVPNKLYWLIIWIKGWVGKKRYRGPKDAEQGSAESGPVQDSCGNTIETVKFKFSAGEVPIYRHTYWISNRFLAEIYFMP